MSKKKLDEILKKPQERSFTLDRSKIDAEARTVELSFSSEYPVERWYGFEILDHGPKAVDLSRLKSGGALLVDHNMRDHVGVVEDCSIEADKKGRARVRFGKSARAQEIFQDVQDGIRQLVSVSYEANKVVREKEENGVETYRVTRWTPLEISIVSIPADPSVGVGRNHENTNTEDMRILQNPDPAPGGGGGGEPEKRSKPEPSVNVEEIRSKARIEEQSRIREIRAIGEKIEGCREAAEQFINEGKSIEEFRKHVVENRMKAKPMELPESPAIGMSEKETKRYSFVRAINCIVNNKPLDGLEREASDAVAKRVKRDPGGFFVPYDVAAASFRRSERALNVNNVTAGGYLVGTDVQYSSMIELLRNNMVVMQLGARSLSGLVGNIAIPKHTGGATAYWLDETSEVTASQQTFGQLGLTPHRLAARTAYTKQLLAQASIDVESFVREDIARVQAIEKDRAALNGSGVEGEPLGLLNTTGLNSVTFGAAPTWAKVVEFETLIDSDNALAGNLGYVTTPAVKGDWKTTVKVSGQAIFLWEGGDMVNGYKALSSNQVPDDKVIFGNWSDLIVADWDGVDVVVDPYTLAATNQVQIIVTIMTDNGVRQPVSFTASTDAGNQ